MISEPKYYILDEDHKPVVVDALVWGKWFGDHRKRRVAYTKVGERFVSTVFLGLDHNYDDEGPPILFETMIFEGDDGGDMWRYATWEEAEKGHAEAVAKVKAGLA